MKILHTVEFYSPSKGGAQEVVRQLSERMAQKGHDVTVATTKLADRKQKTINGVRIEEFDVSGNEVVGMQGEISRYRKFLSEGDFDVVMNYAAQQWATDLTFDVVDNIKARKFIVPCGYSALHNADFAAYFEWLPYILKKYDGSVYLTKHYQDYEFAQTHGLKNLWVIPNGADEREFGTLSTFDFRAKHNIDGFFILTVSNHTGIKGHQETLEAFSKFKETATLVIIGDHTPDGCGKSCQTQAAKINNQAGKRVLLLSTDRQETVAAYQAADVFLFLSNIEASPLVLFEAAAAGLPFISSAVGNAAEIAEWTGGGLIVATHPGDTKDDHVTANITDVVAKLQDLYDHPATRQSLGEQGHKAWHEHYTWESITDEYLKVYRGKSR